MAVVADAEGCMECVVSIVGRRVAARARAAHGAHVRVEEVWGVCDGECRVGEGGAEAEGEGEGAK